jgi:class 3 adenylate cyclase
MRPLPSGIVALLMTDVEASTAAWNTSPMDMDAAVAALDADVHRIAPDHGGVIVKARGEGDSHFVVFSEASRAVRAAAAVQRRGDDRLSVRACVLIGEIQPRNDDYVGAVVNHGARIRSVAHGGQTVVTRAVADVAVAHLSDDLSLRPLGSHRVRDVPQPVELFQLCGPGLRASFPPLRTSAFSSSAVMAVVAVDWVGASRHLGLADDDQVIDWQRALLQSLRGLADEHDGRHLKLLGDGCLVAFEDPRAAVAFASGVHERGPFRIGIALGLVEDIGGELVGRTVVEAHALMRTGGVGDTHCSPVTEAVCPRIS